jgi:hypothetical protein
VVVDHVQHHLEAVGVERLHHLLEVVHGAVARVGREEAERVVAPVVGEVALHQHAVVDEVLHREELDRGHAEGLQVIQHLLDAQSREPALRLRRHVRMAARVAGDVHLVDEAVVGRVVRPAVVAPVEVRVDHLALGHHRGAVAPVERQVLLLVADGVAEMRVAPLVAEAARDAVGVGVDQQLVGVEAVPALGLVGAVHAVAVELPRAHAGKVAVPHEVGALAQRHAADLPLAVLVEEAQLHLFGMAREDREIRALPVPRGAQR